MISIVFSEYWIDVGFYHLVLKWTALEHWVFELNKYKLLINNKVIWLFFDESSSKKLKKLDNFVQSVIKQ